MQGMSESQYAAHVGLSRGAIQKTKAGSRLVQHEDGRIDAVTSDKRRPPEATDLSRTRKPPVPTLKTALKTMERTNGSPQG
jgi:IMP dehydrogenase/GMP reductase